MPMKVTYTVVNGEVLSENRNGVIRDYILILEFDNADILVSDHQKTNRFGYGILS